MVEQRLQAQGIAFAFLLCGFALSVSLPAADASLSFHQHQIFHISIKSFKAHELVRLYLVRVSLTV